MLGLLKAVLWSCTSSDACAGLRCWSAFSRYAGTTVDVRAYKNCRIAGEWGEDSTGI